MKLWFDKNTIDFNKFCSEQFLLLPFFDDKILNQDNDFKNCSKWKESIKNLIQLTTKEDSDAFLFPEKLNIDIGSYILEAKKYNKKLLVFYNDDNESPSCLDNCVKLFRTSLLRSKQKNNEFAMPAWSQDFIDFTSLTTRNKASKPVVSFCGFFSHPLRKQCVEILNANKNIETKFIIRDSFWGGSPHNSQLRAEYINNMVSSDLVLCIRGAGNFSYRLYEALSCGRIPILINTDCVLPCEDKINWKELCIFVDNIDNLNEEINLFWQKYTSSEYEKKQKEARNIYESYLSPDGFAKYIGYNI